MKTTLLILMLAIGCAHAELSDADYDKAFSHFVAGLRVAYPELDQEDSALSKRLEALRDAAVAANPKIENDPTFIVVLAAQAHRETAQAAVVVPAPQQKYTVEQALADARAGHAGMPAKLAAAERSGNPEAIIEANRHRAGQKTQVRLDSGTISTEQAEIERSRAASESEAALTRLEIQRMTEAVERLWQENQRLSREAQFQQQRMRR